MITIEINNRSSLITKLLTSWLKTPDEDSYARSLWGEYFGIGDYEGYDYDYEASYGYYDDEYDEYPRRNSGFSKPVISECEILDDEKLWVAVSEKYDTLEKTKAAVTDYLQHGAPSPFSSAQKEEKELDDDWRKEVLGDNITEDKLITFYIDPTNENYKREFTSVDEFLAYCEDEDIYVDAIAKEDLEYYAQCHCALDAYEASNGVKELRCCRSYGELMYDLYGENLFTTSSTNEDDGFPF